MKVREKAQGIKMQCSKKEHGLCLHKGNKPKDVILLSCNHVVLTQRAPLLSWKRKREALDLLADYTDVKGDRTVKHTWQILKDLSMS